MNENELTEKKPKKYNPHAGHREKLRMRFMRDGLGTFEPHTALELLLFYAIPQRDTNELAHRLIDRFGSLSDVLNAPCEQLMQVNGINEKSAVLISLIPQMMRMYARDLIDRQRLTGRKEIISFIFSQLSSETIEKSLLLCLDNTGAMLSCDCINEGTLTSNTLDFRKIHSLCIDHGATAAILAHNHPRGECRPSAADVNCTRRLMEALSYIDVRLVEHVIVSANDYYCMASSENYNSLFLIR